LLVLRKGMVLTKEVFLNHLYGGMDEPEMKIIDVFICKLRKKLALAGADDVIGTVWGRGYMVRDQPTHAVPSIILSQVLTAPVGVRGVQASISPAIDTMAQLNAA
jgi:two-component system cell cycle response regulator CtrA